MHHPKVYAGAGTFNPAIPSYWVPAPREAAVSGLASSTLSTVALEGNTPATRPLAPQIPLTARQSLEQAYADVAKTIEQENTIVAKGISPAFPVNYAAQSVTGVPIHLRGFPASYNESIDASTSISNEKGVMPVQNAMDEVPDFLSGFDRVAGLGNPIKNTGTMDSLQYSPTFTSRSFDDFHRLLGKSLTPEVKRQGTEAMNLPHIPPAETSSSRPNERVSHSTVRLGMDSSGDLGSASFANACFQRPWPTAPITKPDQLTEQHEFMLTKAYGESLTIAAGAVSKVSGPNEGADAYNLCAQQSAFAASQHSAYTSGHGEDGLALCFGDEMKMGMHSRQPLLTPADNSNRNSSIIDPPFLDSRDMPNTEFATCNFAPVSDPSSTSDQGSDETQIDTSGSGTDNQADGSSNDSDGANSESTRKRRRTASRPISYHGLPIFDGQQHSGDNQFSYSLDNKIGGNFRWTSGRDNQDMYSLL